MYLWTGVAQGYLSPGCVASAGQVGIVEARQGQTVLNALRWSGSPVPFFRLKNLSAGCAKKGLWKRQGVMEVGLRVEFSVDPIGDLQLFEC